MTKAKPSKPRWRTRKNLSTELRTIEWLMDADCGVFAKRVGGFVEIGMCNGTRFAPDLYTVFDLEGFTRTETVGIQVTNYANIASHRRKLGVSERESV